MSDTLRRSFSCSLKLSQLEVLKDPDTMSTRVRTRARTQRTIRSPVTSEQSTYLRLCTFCVIFIYFCLFHEVILIYIYF